jgi:hypothetical protein
MEVHMEEKYQEILSKIKKADSIVIGASNGLAISEGINIFAEDSSFLEHFSDFQKKYGFRNIVQGAFYSYPSEEEKWAFFSRMYAYFLNNKEASPVMKNLYELVQSPNQSKSLMNNGIHSWKKRLSFEIGGKQMEKAPKDTRVIVGMSGGVKIAGDLIIRKGQV